jgi:hypothetical protein
MFGIRDPGSGKNSFRIPDPWGIKAPDPGSVSATLIVPVSDLKVEVFCSSVTDLNSVEMCLYLYRTYVFGLDSYQYLDPVYSPH